MHVPTDSLIPLNPDYCHEKNVFAPDVTDPVSFWPRTLPKKTSARFCNDFQSDVAG